jgi:CHASE3 domain sensor protein
LNWPCYPAHHIGAASIGLDLKSRSDTATVDRALGILGKISDMRPLLRRAESAARAFALTGDQQFASEYRSASDTILPALDVLIEAVKANPRAAVEETKALVARQIALNGELVRLRNSGDHAGIAALVSQDDGSMTATIAGNLAKAVAEERRLLPPDAESETDGRLLLRLISSASR